MYCCSKCILLESKVFFISDLSHCTNALPVLESSFLDQCYFVLWLKSQTVKYAAERQISVLGDVRWTQEKEIIVIDQAYVV